MDSDPIKLNPGEILRNADIVSRFQVGNMGGMRRSLKSNVLIIVSDPFKAFYDDKWDGSVFHYTGMGKRGDQSLNSAQNKTLAHSNDNGVAVHLFEVFSPGEYTYIGQVRLDKAPYQQKQDDINGVARNVWIFPLRVVTGNEVLVSNDKIRSREQSRSQKARRATDAEVRNRATKSGAKSPSKRSATVVTYERNPWVIEHAKRRANGVCELCGNKAPFRKLGGEPCLETHHLIWLSKGGEDTIDNTVALCPNCHRKMHLLGADSDLSALKLISK